MKHVTVLEFCYLCQMNRVNSRDVFVRCVSVNQTFKMVKATDFRFDMHASRDSPDIF